jgi:hypothetical protein
MSLIVKSNVKKESEFAVSEEFLKEFEKKVSSLLNKAEQRAESNFRKTLFARDL